MKALHAGHGGSMLYEMSIIDACSGARSASPNVSPKRQSPACAEQPTVLVGGESYRLIQWHRPYRAKGIALNRPFQKANA